jgi:hypothetical protein
VVTFRQVREAQPAAWHATAAGWRRLAASLAARADSVERLRTLLMTHWRGAAAEAALAALGRLRAALLAARGPLLAADQALAGHATDVERAQRRLDAVLAEIGSTRVCVDADGVAQVSYAGGRPDPGELATARRITAAIGAIIAAVTLTDERTAARLAAAGVGFQTLNGPPACPPPDGTPPEEVRRWWDRLGAGERAWLLAYRPEVIGGLDGVPVAVRDAANRLVLNRLLVSTSDDRARRGLAALAARLERSEPARAYLLGVDAAGDGRAIVAVGDPDTAGHVLTYVPGAGSHLGKLDRLIGHADRLAGAADGAAVVLWLGYDAPDGLDATGVGAARDGAGALDRFQDGLRATATGERAHHTVLGHSYGSLVVGTAAHERGLTADDLVFVGSPGVGVDRAGDLGVPGTHVWSCTARYDAIRLAALADRQMEWFDRDPREDLWHGADPSRRSFEGQVFSSDPGDWWHAAAAHNAYFDEGNPSLNAIGAIARGDYAAVR